MTLLAVAALLAAALGVLQAGALELFRVPTPSMIPTLIPGDVFVADRRISLGEPLTGEIILFEPPGGKTYFAKRVAARAGSTVALVSGRLVVDGLEHSIDTRQTPWRHVEQIAKNRYEVDVRPGPQPLDFGPMRVPAGHVFVLGDSRGYSADSRSFGPVPLHAIRGRALRVIWSRNQAQQLRWERTLTPLEGDTPFLDPGR